MQEIQLDFVHNEIIRHYNEVDAVCGRKLIIPETLTAVYIIYHAKQKKFVKS